MQLLHAFFDNSGFIAVLVKTYPLFESEAAALLTIEQNEGEQVLTVGLLVEEKPPF